MRRFQRADLQAVNEWLRGWNAPPLTLDVLPEFGLVVEGVACGFLYATDSSVCLFENFVTNREATVSARHGAILDVAEALVREAHGRGYRIAVALTRSESIKRAAKLIGFVPIGSREMLTIEV